MIKKSFTMQELIIVVTIVSVLASIGVANYRTAIIKANGRLAGKVLQLIFAGEIIYSDQNGGATVSCTSITDCASKLKIELPTSFPGVVCYNKSCSGGCVQATGDNLGSSYSISFANNAVNANQCPCACP